MNHQMKKRATNKQLDFLIDQLLQNIDLARGSPSDRKVNEMWTKLTLQLNTMGCKRDVSEWQHIWAVRVSKLKTKVRAMRLPDSNITLSENEKKVLTIAGGASSVSDSPFTRLNQSINELDLYLRSTTNKNYLKQSLTKDCSMETENPSNIMPSKCTTNKNNLKQSLTKDCSMETENPSNIIPSKCTTNKNNLKQSLTKDCSMETENPSNIIPSTSTQCRVCLMSGEDQIPIFNQNSVIAEQLQLICGIDIKLNDGYPQHLCISCSHLLQVAILFRKTAETSLLKLISETRSPEIKKEIEDSEDNTHEAEIIEQDISSIQTNDDDPLILQKVSNIAVKCEDVDICEEMDITNRDQNKKNHLNLNEIEEDCSESDVSVDMEEQGKTVATNNTQSNEVLTNLLLLSGKYYRQIGKFKNRSVFECTICYKKVKYNKITHLKKHFYNGPLYVCDKCGKAFTVSSTFQRHLADHHTDRKFIYKCDKCPYKGHRKDLLTNHMKIHSKEYKHICPICPKMFRQACNFVRHVRRHDKPTLKCELCGKLFYENFGLKKHIAERHEDNFTPNPCKVCGKVYGNKRLLFRHERGVHKREKYTQNRALYLKEKSNDTPDISDSS